MLTAAELDEMRETLEDSLPDTAVIQTSGWVSDGGGGGTTSWTAAGTVPCRVAPLSGEERVEGARVDPDAQYVFTFPWDASVTTDSQVVCSGGTFAVTAAREPRSWELSRRVEAKEIT